MSIADICWTKWICQLVLMRKKMEEHDTKKWRSLRGTTIIFEWKRGWSSYFIPVKHLVSQVVYLQQKLRCIFSFNIGGDASIIPCSSSDIYRTGAKCLANEKDPKLPGANYHILGAFRTKPGRGSSIHLVILLLLSSTRCLLQVSRPCLCLVPIKFWSG